MDGGGPGRDSNRPWPASPCPLQRRCRPANQFAALSAVPPPIPDTDDEDAAEARRAPDENFATLQSQAPQLASVAQPPKPAPVAAVPPAVAQAAAAPIPACEARDTGCAPADASRRRQPQATPDCS